VSFYELSSVSMFLVLAKILSLVQSTLGAGDTFTAGILYALMCHKDDWSLFRMLSFANRLAGLKVRQEGFDDLGKQLWRSLSHDPIIEPDG
jgi:fructose-1-phosphate kinase PfkB-like protein